MIPAGNVGGVEFITNLPISVTHGIVLPKSHGDNFEAQDRPSDQREMLEQNPEVAPDHSCPRLPIWTMWRITG
jgi:hypothetical protein